MRDSSTPAIDVAVPAQVLLLFRHSAPVPSLSAGFHFEIVSCPLHAGNALSTLQSPPAHFNYSAQTSEPHHRVSDSSTSNSITMFTAGVVYPLTTMLTSLLLVTTSWATPLDFDRKPHIVEDIGPLLARQAQAPFNVAGVQGGGVKQRLEIRQLQQTGDQWNIFLLGLARMQAADQQDPLSYYQIAGRQISIGKRV